MSAYKKWTMPELEKLKLLYPNFSNEILAKEFNATEKSIYSKAWRMNLYKSEKYLSTIRFRDGNDLHLLSGKNKQVKVSDTEIYHVRIVKSESTLIHRCI